MEAGRHSALAAQRATHRGERAVLESDSGRRARAARRCPNNDEPPHPHGVAPGKGSRAESGQGCQPVPSATGPGSARICQLILPTWLPESSRLRAPTTPPAALAGRQRAPSRPLPSPVRAPSASPPPEALPCPRLTHRHSPRPRRGPDANHDGGAGTGPRKGGLRNGAAPSPRGCKARRAAGTDRQPEPGSPGETEGWCGALRGPAGCCTPARARRGPPTPRGRCSPPTRCLGGEAPSVPAAPAPPGASSAPTPPAPRPGALPRRPPRRALPARRQQRPPSVLPQPRCGPMGGRAGSAAAAARGGAGGRARTLLSASSGRRDPQGTSSQPHHAAARSRNEGHGGRASGGPGRNDRPAAAAAEQLGLARAPARTAAVRVPRVSPREAPPAAAACAGHRPEPGRGASPRPALRTRLAWTAANQRAELEAAGQSQGELKGGW